MYTISQILVMILVLENQFFFSVYVHFKTLYNEYDPMLSVHKLQDPTCWLLVNSLGQLVTGLGCGGLVMQNITGSSPGHLTVILNQYHSRLVLLLLLIDISSPQIAIVHRDRQKKVKQVFSWYFSPPDSMVIFIQNPSYTRASFLSGQNISPPKIPTVPQSFTNYFTIFNIFLLL